MAKPLRLIFNIVVSIEPFNEFIRALFNLRPSIPQTKVSWYLDKVLSIALFERFQRDPSGEDLLMLTLFN